MILRSCQLSVIFPFFSPQGILLTSGVLEALTCGEGRDSELNTILSVPEKQQALLHAYQMAVCGGEAGQKAERFAQISQELRDQIDTQRIIDKVQSVMNTCPMVIRLAFLFSCPSSHSSIHLSIPLINLSVYLYLRVSILLFLNPCFYLAIHFLRHSPNNPSIHPSPFPFIHPFMSSTYPSILSIYSSLFPILNFILD